MQIDPTKPNFESPIHYGNGPEANSVTLTHVIVSRFPNGMPEDFMAIIMRDILRALSYLHVHLASDHNDLNSGNVSVNTGRAFTAIKIVLDPDRNFAHDVPGGEISLIPTAGIWGLGTIALEMAYGSLPRNCNSKDLLLSLANNVVRILKLKLDIADEEGQEKAKKETATQRRKGRLVISDYQELKEKVMEKGKGTLKIVDDPKGKGKAMQKGKEKLELADDPKGKEMAEQKGKEKVEIAEDKKGTEMGKRKRTEVKKLTIKLPPLEQLMNDFYVEQLERKLKEEKKKKKQAMAELTEKFMVMPFFGKKDTADTRKFSRDFVEVVLICLDEQKQTTTEQILAHPFFKQPLDMPEFERSMR